jgi:predicted DNA-binding WGR domain protein
MMVTLYKPDKTGRMRYYSISNRQGNLFSPFTFTVTWGVALSAGRERQYVFESQRDLDQKLRELVNSRLKAGYKVLYTFFRKEERERLRPLIQRTRVS